MKFTLLPLLATAFPLLLVQHATPANAAALCIPGIYCPESVTLPSPAPECSCTAGGGGGGSSSSSTSSTTYHTTFSSSSKAKTTSTWTPTSTWSSSPTVTKPSSSTTSHAPGGGSTTVTISTGGAPSGSSSKPIGSSSGGSGPTTTTTVTVTGGPAPTGTTCSTGPVQCCDSLEPSSSENAASIMALLGIVLSGTNVPVGLNCVPISVIGLGSAGTCNAQTVCCENDSFSGLINIGCSPINIGL